MKKEEGKNVVLLYTTEIDDYEQLRKDYLEYCRMEDITPEEGGEYQWQAENNADDLILFYEDSVPMLEDQNPTGLWLCVGSTGRWTGRHSGGRIVSDLKGIIRDLGDRMDDTIIKLENGSIEHCGKHHDGRNSYSIRALNRRARRTMEAFENREGFNGYDCRELHETLDKPFYWKALKDE